MLFNAVWHRQKKPRKHGGSRRIPTRYLTTLTVLTVPSAMTTLGFREIAAEAVAHLVADILDAPHDEAVIAAVRAKVSALCQRYPVYG